MSLQNLKDLYVHELKDLYSAEKQLTDAIPAMALAANNRDLVAGFNKHLDETEQHLEKVNSLLRSHDTNPGNTKCDAMEGLVKEAEGIIREKAAPAVKDAALIAAAQRVEHYEMSGYGTAREFAHALGLGEDVRVLDGILDEESATNEKLTRLAREQVNPAALNGSR